MVRAKSDGPRMNSPTGFNSSRSLLMKRVKRQDTAPELRVRRRLHAHGLRFRLNVTTLPGRPDLVLPRRRTAVFVHGCFWHGHDCPHGRVQAKSNAAFWAEKIATNRLRDQRKAGELRGMGWIVETVWECETKDDRRLDALASRLLER